MLTDRADGEVRTIIANQLGLDARQVTDEKTLLRDLGGDELDRLEMMITIEEEFHVVIADEEEEKLVTVGDVVKLVDSLVIEGGAKIRFGDDD